MDPALYREVMGHHPTGVVVVTGLVDDAPVGMVVGTFSSVSMDPPLVSFMPMKTSGSYARLLGAPSLCINILAHDQGDTCRTLASGSPDKFDHVSWTLSPQGAPVLTDAVAHIHARVHQQVDAGDHWITLCAVDAMEVVRPVTPLLFFQGGYGGFSPRDMTAFGDADLITALRLADPARRHIEALATSLQCEASALVAVNEDELTTAVSAWGGSAELVERLGHRIPLIPPIGEAYVAGARPEVVERWLAKVSDPELQESYRQRLAKVAADGIAVTMVGRDARADFQRLRDILSEYATGPLTPARERALRTTLAETRHFFDDVPIRDDEIYDVDSIVAPVLNPEGDVSIIVRAGQLPTQAPGYTVRTWVAAVRETARAIEQELSRGPGHDRLQNYRLWYAYTSDFPG